MDIYLVKKKKSIVEKLYEFVTLVTPDTCVTFRDLSELSGEGWFS